VEIGTSEAKQIGLSYFNSKIKIKQDKNQMKNNNENFVEEAGLEVADRCALSLRSPLLKYLQCYGTKLKKC